MPNGSSHAPALIAILAVIALVMIIIAVRYTTGASGRNSQGFAAAAVCSSDSDCVARMLGTRCVPADGGGRRCVRCTIDADCGGGRACANNVCARICATDDDCPNNAHPVCVRGDAGGRGLCV